MLDNWPGDLDYWYRHISKGGWPFSTADQGWLISDCTAEGLKATNYLSYTCWPSILLILYFSPLTHLIFLLLGCTLAFKIVIRYCWRATGCKEILWCCQCYFIFTGNASYCENLVPHWCALVFVFCMVNIILLLASLLLSVEIFWA